MDALPDEVLLLILERLEPNPRQLVLCVRAVCRRWRRVALSPSLWRRHFLHLNERVDTLAARDAPCTRELCVWAEALRRGAVLGALEGTRCAAEELMLGVEPGVEGAALRLLLERQAALGRLRRLSLDMSGKIERGFIWKAVRAVVTSPQLEELELTPSEDDDLLPLPSLEDWPASGGRLKLLEISNADGAVVMPALRFLVAALAGTLEEVSVELRGDRDHPAPLPSLGDTLAQCPRLRSACVPVRDVPGLLQACRQVTELRLMVFTLSGVPEALLSLERHGSHLQALSLCTRIGDNVEVDVHGVVYDPMQWVYALASSGQSQLQKLVVYGWSTWTQRLLSALHRLPRLRTLYALEVRPRPSLLRGLASTTVQLLDFGPPSPPACGEEYRVSPCFGEPPRRGRPPCFLAEARRLLRGRRLHVVGVNHRNPRCEGAPSCRCCCCRDNPPEWRLQGVLSLCGCAEPQRCPVRQEVAARPWVHCA